MLPSIFLRIRTLAFAKSGMAASWRSLGRLSVLLAFAYATSVLGTGVPTLEFTRGPGSHEVGAG